MKLLSGKELALFIKERQAHQVRNLIQASNIQPKLAIIVTVENPVIDLYMRLKQKYAEDLGAEVVIHRIEQNDVPGKIIDLNGDSTVQGIILQLPLKEPSETEKLVNLVSPDKDVDGLGIKANFDPATPLAILWLLAGYNIELKAKNVLVIGRGKLVGSPLINILEKSGIEAIVADKSTKDLKNLTIEADVIITATGSSEVLTSDMIKQGGVVVDAGVASEDGKTVGDVSSEVYERDDLTITPQKGGVGPLTVCALFENLIIASKRTISTDQ